MIAVQTQAIAAPALISLRGGRAEAPLPQDDEERLAQAQALFKDAYPAYFATSTLDELRETEYGRLASAETYVDYTGASLFPQQLVLEHGKMLLQSGELFGNAHSRSESSRRSSELAYEARLTVLKFFDADPEEYSVIFTPNATGALKMVGESYPYKGDSSTIFLPVDAHNSVHGLRVFAERCGAQVQYYGCGDRGGVDMVDLASKLEASQHGPSLLVVTGQSNVTGAKAPLQEILPLAQRRGCHILLDAAALAPTSHFSLRETPVDACAVSFYKIMGYPTGLGALVVRRTFARTVMRRVWFAGGTVTAVQVPGAGPASYHFVAPPEETECPIAQNAFEQHESSDHAPSDVDAEKWEDGTINYLSIPAVKMGLELVAQYKPFLPARLTVLTDYLAKGLLRLTHPKNGAPIVLIVSTLPDVDRPGACGPLVSCVFLNAAGKPIRNDVVEKSARASRIALRTGCLCNPYSVFGLLHRSGKFPARETADGMVDLDWWMKNMHLGMRGKDEIANLLFEGDPNFGLVRISLGLVSNFEDVYRVLKWAEHAVPTL
ncbi:PLP-dependent transferase [Auriculariales sp. MPI-PUGE-AT-0066]|nr:PLP-dependent transferase [Auriculariales sp. MPI-PUGE-AT-0066]